jgi:hypothetical protein
MKISHVRDSNSGRGGGRLGFRRRRQEEATGGVEECGDGVRRQQRFIIEVRVCWGASDGEDYSDHRSFRGRR